MGGGKFIQRKKSERWEDYGRVGWLRLQDVFLMGIIGFQKRERERWKKGQVIVITDDFKMLKFFDSFDFSLNFLNFMEVKFSI